MNLPPRVLVRACITATALCGATLLFSTSASAAPAEGPLPGVTLPPVTLPPLPPPPQLPIPLPTIPKATPAPTAPATPAPAVPAVPTIPAVTIPAPPGGSLPTPTLPTLPGGSTPTLPPEVTIPDVPGVDLELCAKLELTGQPLLDTCVKDANAEATTTTTAKPASPSDPADPPTEAKAATASPASSSGGSGGGGSTGSGTLARTGSDLGTPVAIGAGLAALGGLALAASRLLPRFAPRLLGRVFIQ